MTFLQQLALIWLDSKVTVCYSKNLLDSISLIFVLGWLEFINSKSSIKYDLDYVWLDQYSCKKKSFFKKQVNFIELIFVFDSHRSWVVFFPSIEFDFKIIYSLIFEIKLNLIYTSYFEKKLIIVFSGQYSKSKFDY